MDDPRRPRVFAPAIAARRRANLSAVLLDGNPALVPGAPALRTADATWTYAELVDATGPAAAWLARRGVRRGDVALLALPDAPRWVALFLGAARVGAVCALAGHALGAGALRSLARGLAPALVVHDGPRLAALASSYGLGNALYFPLGAGAAAWLEPGARTPAGAERACRDGGVTALFGVPTGWARLARHAAEGRVRRSVFAGVRLAVSAGEPLSPQVWHAVARELELRL